MVAAFACPAWGAMVSVGGDTGAWVVRPSEPGRVLVDHLLRTSDGIIALPALSLGMEPEAVAGDAGQLVMVFAPADGVRRVYRLARAGVGGATPRFAPLETLPPLPEGGRVSGAVQVNSEIFVLIEHAAKEGGPCATLLRLESVQWAEVALPPSAGGSLRIQPGIAGVVRLVDGAGHAWSLRTPRLEWSGPESSIDASGAAFSLGGYGVGFASREASGAVAIQLYGRDGLIGKAVANDVRSDWTACELGGVCLVASSDKGASELACQLLTSSGVEVFKGLATAEGPISRQDVWMLAIILGSLFLSMLLFILYPQRGAKGGAIPPIGCAAAEPSRRAAATAADLMPAMMLVDIAIRLWPEAVGGPVAMALVAVVMFLHGVIGETCFGQTIGKALLGCRVIDSNGRSPSLSRSAARNLVKTLCPMLGLVVVFGGRRLLHPGTFGTMVVVGHPSLADAPERVEVDEGGVQDSGGKPDAGAGTGTDKQ